MTTFASFFECELLTFLSGFNHIEAVSVMDHGLGKRGFREVMVDVWVHRQKDCVLGIF